MAYTQPASAQERRIGVIPHAPLLKTAVPDTANQEVAVYHVEYEPGGINPRHLHPAAVTFHILSASGRRKVNRQSLYALATVCSFRPAPFMLTGIRVQRRDSAFSNSSWLKRTKGGPFQNHWKTSVCRGLGNSVRAGSS